MSKDKINFKELSNINSKIGDSKTDKDVKTKRERISDSLKRKSLKRRIKDELDETETTAEAINVVSEALKNEPAEEVALAAVEILSETVDFLQEQLEAKESTETVTDNKKPKGGLKFRQLKKKIKDELEETETTAEAVDVIVSYLESQDPKDVIHAAIDVIGQTVDELQEMV